MVNFILYVSNLKGGMEARNSRDPSALRLHRNEMIHGKEL